ncbi:MAG: ABC transporter permease [Thermoplasmata archaeon]|jgi:peptide/nickel transport system permease protein
MRSGKESEASKASERPRPGSIREWASRHESFVKETRYSMYLFSRSYLSMVGLIIILAMVAVAVLTPWIAPYHPNYQRLDGSRQEFWPAQQAGRPLAPSSSHWFGTDNQGRDILSMVLYGTWKALFIGAIVVGPAALIGVILGAVAGYIGGLLGEAIMRITDVFLSIPSLVLAMAISLALGPSLIHIAYSLIVTWWPWYTRLVFGQVLSIREKQYVEASRSVGAGTGRILFKHVIKNSLSPVIVQITSDYGFVILEAASLSWMGLGAPVGTAEWGRLITEGQTYVFQAWWFVAFPGLAIVMSVLGFNLLGDGLRDVLDPKLRR